MASLPTREEDLPKNWPPPPPESQIEIPKTKTGQIWMALRMISLQDFYHLGEMPCVRQAFLIGIGSGVGIMAVRMMKTSAFWAANWGAGAFAVTSSGSFLLCQNRLANEKRTMNMIKEKYPHRNVRTAKQRAEEARRQAEGGGAAEGSESGSGTTSS
ncbi:hypothetical protein CALCODRAFT_487866 [Calocera cornea HHB12733]|uniref:Cytochrome c oxidase assembly protein COX20, mitochondrial n=1 Tax=Calocera cornea HHB12733 TaxID=1353952 RepID=A0A165CW45_9BASI|nr:hypothetical protein CALCODRAFT_487866 [Calocera cornea HHB12733]